MKVTKPINMRLIDIQQNVPIQINQLLQHKKSGWFKIIDTSHSKVGLDFCIPLEHPEYDEKLQNELSNLDIEDNICLKLQSMNKRNTLWIVKEIIQ